MSIETNPGDGTEPTIDHAEAVRDCIGFHSSVYEIGSCNLSFASVEVWASSLMGTATKELRTAGYEIRSAEGNNQKWHPDDAVKFLIGPSE